MDINQYKPRHKITKQRLFRLDNTPVEDIAEILHMAKELKIKRLIAGSIWEISLDEKNKISKIILKANIYEL